MTLGVKHRGLCVMFDFRAYDMASDNGTIFRDEIIACEQLQKEPVVCPRCGDNNLKLYGFIMLEREEILEAGKTVGENWPNYPRDGAYIMGSAANDWSCSLNLSHYPVPKKIICKSALMLRK